MEKLDGCKSTQNYGACDHRPEYTNNSRVTAIKQIQFELKSSQGGTAQSNSSQVALDTSEAKVTPGKQKDQSVLNS